jgi:hypothetical protein
MEVLKGNKIYAVTIDSTELMTKAGANGSVPRQYWRGRYAGKGFIVTDPKFIEDWNAGNVAQIMLQESSYLTDQADPENPEQKLRRDAMTFSGYATRQQALGTARFEAEESLVKVKVLKDMQLTDEDVRLLQAAF